MSSDRDGPTVAAADHQPTDQVIEPDPTCPDCGRVLRPEDAHRRRWASWAYLRVPLVSAASGA